jgi:hypothetical protein
MYDPLGLSIGSTNLVAARDGSAPVSRRSVLTLYPHCAPKIGVLEQDPGSTEPGVPMAGFVERIGDSVALVSGDGSAHDPDLLLVEALDAMVRAAGADAASAEISIAVPAYWKPGTIQALRNGLRTHVGFVRSGMAPRLVPDSIAALTAANAELCLAATGVVALVDFGGSGTSATLINIAGDFQPVSATMRYADFSGDQIDQALLLRVFEELGHGSGIDPASTAGVGQLGQLREQCRAAKERLSTDPATEFVAELGGRRCTMRVTRQELGDLIQDRLTGFIYAFDDVLSRCQKSWTDLAAVVTVGGGASIPLVNERLSVHSRRPVVTVALPAFAAASGALLLASRGEELDLRTRTSVGLLAGAVTGGEFIDIPAARDVLVIDDEALTDRELAWSQTDYPGDIRVPYTPEAFDEDNPAGWSMRLNLMDPPPEPAWRRLRLSQLIIGMCALVAMTAIGGVAYTLAGIESHQVPPAPTVVPQPAPPVSSLAPSPVPPPPPSAVPAPSAQPVPSAEPVPTTVAPPPPPPPPVVVTTQPPPVLTTRRPPPPPPSTTQPPPPPSTAMTTTPPPPPTTTSPPPPPPTTSSKVPMATQWIHVPLLPVPIPVPIPQSQAPQYSGGSQQNQNPFLGPGG